MPNIFNNDTTLPQRIRNINKLNIDQNVIVSINESNEATAQPISTYGASLLNVTDSNALATSILKNTEESITFLADGANEINFHTGLNGGLPTNGNLRLKVDDNDVTSYNDLKIQNGNNTIRLKLINANASLIDAENSELRIEGSNGVNITKNDANVLSSNGNNLNLYKPQTGQLKMTIGDNIDVITDVNIKDGSDYLAISQTGNQSKLKPSSAGGLKLESNDEATGITIVGNRTTLNSPELMLSNTSIYADTGAVIYAKEIRSNGSSGDHDIGSSSTRFNNVYSTTNDSNNYKIADGGKIIAGSTELFRFLDGGGYGLPTTYLYQLPATKIARFCKNGFTSNYLEFDTFAGDINVGVPLNTNAIFATDITATSFSMDQANKGYLKLLPGTSGQSTEAGNIEFYGSDDIRRYLISSGLGAVNRLTISSEPGLSNASIMLNIDGNGDYEFTETAFQIKDDRRVEFSNGTYNNYIFQQPPGAGGYGLNLTYNYYKNQDSPYANVIPDSGVGTSRISLQGTSIDFAVGAIGNAPSSSFVINTGDVSSYKKLIPIANNSVSLGDSLKRWTEVFAVNGTINTSDRREKTDIKYLDEGLSLINKLKPCSYKWKENSHGRKHYGLIAQDVEMIQEFKNSGAYIHDKESDNKGLRYTEFISVLIKSVQELNNKFNQLDCSGVIIKEVESKPLLPVLGEIDCDCDCNIEKINMLEERINEKLEEVNNNHKLEINKLQDVNNNLLNANDELIMKVNELENKLDNYQQQPQHNSSDDESDNSHSILDLIQQRLHELEKRNNKLEQKLKKATSLINKLVKTQGE